MLRLVLLLAVCPVYLYEPTGDYVTWFEQSCCVWGREGGGGVLTATACLPGSAFRGHVCKWRPGWPGTLHHVARHVGPAPDKEIEGVTWFPSAAGTWIIDLEHRTDGMVNRSWSWQEEVTEACEQPPPPPEPPLFADGYESADTSAWSWTVIRLGPEIFSSGFEEGDVSAWR